MPIISIKMAKGRSLETKQEFVDILTKEAVRLLDVQPEWVTVIFEEYERENWASGGQLHAIKYGDGFGKTGNGNA